MRGCPTVPPETLAEWGSKGFLIGAYSAPTAIALHAHHPLQISLPLVGSWSHAFGRTRSIVRPGTAAFIPPCETHDTRGVEPGELITINAELEWCEEHCDLAPSTLRDAKWRMGSVSHLHAMLRQAPTLLRQRDRDELYLASLALTTTLGVIHALGLRPPRAARLTHPALRRVTRWIDEHLGERLTLATLATVAGCSQWHLIRLFSATLGATPAKYIVMRRLERSHALLRVPGADIGEVALSCGFSSQSHFTRAFSRAYHETPGAYRKNRQHIAIA